MPVPNTKPLQQPRAYSTSAAPLATAAAPFAPSTERGSDVQRINIGVFGLMNAGKSTLINRITRQETSIVDSTPGTTADVKVALMELHDLGPAKLFDTAGIDEAGELGAKKRRKTLSTLKECDVALLVLDLARLRALAAPGTPSAPLRAALHWEDLLLSTAAKHAVTPLLLFNARGIPRSEAGRIADIVRGLLDPAHQLPAMPLDLNAASQDEAGRDVSSAVSLFLQDGVARSKARSITRSLPDDVLRPDAMVFLNIPMDAETPSMRLLRPQALVQVCKTGVLDIAAMADAPVWCTVAACLCQHHAGWLYLPVTHYNACIGCDLCLQEEAIRHWATTIAYRMDLARARSSNPADVAVERGRFSQALKPLLEHPGPKVLVTDSQAVDIVHPWTMGEDGKPLVPFTTFSICMIQRMSSGKLPLFVDGLRAFKSLKSGDRVLVAEACNHNRITDNCMDIGMVQITRKVNEAVGGGVQLDHAFGREYPEVESGALGQYKLAIHCGGCMIDAQKMRAR